MAIDVRKNTYICKNFSVQLAISIVKFFNAKRWLDISAGWGDRLLAAIATNIDYYCATDPNKNLFKHYEKIIDDFGVDKSKYNLINSPFEDAKLPENIKYDLAFTSPPFFIFEKYSGKDTQSTEKFKSLKNWKELFLFKSVKKAFDQLEDNGHLVLYITDMPEYRYMSDLFKYIKNIKKAVYVGQIYFYSGYEEYKSIFTRSVYVWKKKI